MHSTVQQTPLTQLSTISPNRKTTSSCLSQIHVGASKMRESFTREVETLYSEIN